MAYQYPLNGGRINASMAGNTANAGTLISTGTMYLSGGNNITLSQNGNSIGISGANITQSDQALSGSNGSLAFQTATFGNLNGMSFYTSNGSMVGSYTVPTQTAYAFSNSNGVSFGTNGATVTATVATDYAASNHSHGNPTLALTNLSGTTASASNGLTLSLSAAAPGAGGGAAFSAGTQSVSTGTVNFANSNGVTFGMSGSNQITASVAAQSDQIIAFSAGSNTSLTSTGTLDARSLYINAHGLSAGFSQSSIFLSAHTTYAASNHSHGNPTLALTNLSGTTASASNGLTLSLSAAAPGAGGGVAIANSQTTYQTGTVNLLEGGGAITIASTTGQKYNFSVPAVSSLSATGAVSISQNGSTISIGVPMFGAGASNTVAGGTTYGTMATANTGGMAIYAGSNIGLSQSTDAGNVSITIQAAGGGGANTIDFYQNMDRGTSAALGTANGTLMLQRLNQENNQFGHGITANTFLMNMTANMTATSLSSSHTVSVSIGIYSDNNTIVNLINSASTSWALGANTSNTANYHGPRWLSFVSSQWSSAPVFSEGGEYVFGIIFRMSNYGPPMSYIGQNYMHSLQRSGSIGTTVATNTSLAHGNYWNAMYTATSAALPAAITSNQVNRNNATAQFMPHIILNNRYSGTF